MLHSSLKRCADLLLGTDDSPRRARLHTAIGKGNGASEENGVSEENAEAGAEPGA